MGEEQKPLVGQMRPQVLPVEAPEEDEWEDPEPVWGPYDREARRAVRVGRALRAVEGDYAEAEMKAVASAGLFDDIAAARDEQARNEVIVAAKAAGMSPAEWFAAALSAPVQMLQGEPVVRRGEPEVYPPAGYTGLTAAQAAALRGAWEGAHLQRNGGEGFVESEDGHVFKLSDAANAHMKRVGAVYTACQWAAGQAQPVSAHPGGQSRDWTPGARFRFTPAPLREAGEEVGVTLICVVPGSDIHRAQVIFRADNAATPRALLVGLWQLCTRPEGA